eukprot:935133-Pelagomonas_calceolata.AAC.1
MLRTNLIFRCARSNYVDETGVACHVMHLGQTLTNKVTVQGGDYPGQMVGLDSLSHIEKHFPAGASEERTQVFDTIVECTFVIHAAHVFDSSPGMS